MNDQVLHIWSQVSPYFHHFPVGGDEPGIATFGRRKNLETASHASCRIWGKSRRGNCPVFAFWLSLFDRGVCRTLARGWAGVVFFSEIPCRKVPFTIRRQGVDFRIHRQRMGHMVPLAWGTAQHGARPGLIPSDRQRFSFGMKNTIIADVQH